MLPIPPPGARVAPSQHSLLLLAWVVCVGGVGGVWWVGSDDYVKPQTELGSVDVGLGCDNTSNLVVTDYFI